MSAVGFCRHGLQHEEMARRSPNCTQVSSNYPNCLAALGVKESMLRGTSHLLNPLCRRLLRRRDLRLVRDCLRAAAVDSRRTFEGSRQFLRAVYGSSSCLYSTSAVKCSQSGPMNVRPIGVGSAAPSTILTNADLEQMVETSDEWIQSRTGMQQRRVLTQGECLRDFAVQAAQNALDMASVAPHELGLVICASSTPDDLLGDAPSIAHALGCNSHTLAFDLVAACSGFLFGVVTASKFLSSPAAMTSGSTSSKALVIGADSLSRWIDWDDRNICILFGDGAGAMVLEACDVPGILGYAAHSNGGGYADLNARYVGDDRLISTSTTPTVLQSGAFAKVFMNGKEVYKFATREVPTVIQEVLVASDRSVDDINWLLMHQANLRITEAVVQRVGISMDKVLSNLHKYGNTSAASMPLALDEAVRSNQVRTGDTILCAGFGAGLSWGAALLQWQGGS